ncbi:MAG: HD domain-containing protein [Calditrichaeota bacterium]|nr:MAG: HD domain-containing protein [Calditrichota bacterium]
MFKEEQKSIDHINQLITAIPAKFEIIELFLQLDSYTRFHSYRVKEIVVAMASLHGMNQDQTEELTLAAYLHDLGKTAIPAELLNKSTRLNAQELKHVRMHAKIGADMCKIFKLSQTLIEAVRCHHEYFNGAGYPFGLAASSIPLASRIISIADALDVMLSGRKYSKPRSLSDAVKIMIHNSGSQFDPALVSTLLQKIEHKDSADWVKNAASFH